MRRALKVTTGLRFVVRDQTPVDRQRLALKEEYIWCRSDFLFFFFFFFLMDCFPKFQDQEDFEAVLHRNRNSRTFWEVLRAVKLLLSSPLGPWPVFLSQPSSKGKLWPWLSPNGRNKGKLRLLLPDFSGRWKSSLMDQSCGGWWIMIKQRALVLCMFCQRCVSHPFLSLKPSLRYLKSRLAHCKERGLWCSNRPRWVS